MQVLVTGGAGFIGSQIVDRLIKKGYDVAVVDDISSGYEKNINEKARFYKLDIQDQELEAVFQKESPDYIIHLAAQKDVRFSVSEPILDAKINILGTLNILENCIKYKVQKVVFASTGGAIYGEQDFFPASETHPERPISPYGITKFMVERYLFYYNVVHGLDYACLRYANVYGPRQDPFGEAGVIAIFIQKLLKGDSPIINGSGEQTRDFIYVDDVVNSNLLAIQNSTDEKIFNIGTGVETNINDIFRNLREIINPSIQEKHSAQKQGEQMRSVIECEKAKKILHWEPETSLPNGLKKTCEYFSAFHEFK